MMHANTPCGSGSPPPDIDLGIGPHASRARSLVKAVSYRVIVMCADALAIFILTGAWRVAVGFMIASNLYTTALYFLHERLWARIRWGLKPAGG